jgi:gamma interferon inducible lysosomal thiol reductase (GILT)
MVRGGETDSPSQDCLRDMILPVMMRVQDKVNWTLSFVGTPTANDGVDCRHGPSECTNILFPFMAYFL